MNATNPSEVTGRLTRGAWFGSLPVSLRDAIVERLVSRAFARGEIIAAQGSRPRGLYVVTHGHVAWKRSIGAHGKVLLYIAGPGAWFGQSALVRGTTMPFEVVAHGSTRVLLLPRLAYERLIRENATYYERFADHALERMELLIRLYSESLSLRSEDLISTRLATLAALRRAESGQSGRAVELTVGQADLAAMIGVSRQTLSVALKRLEAEGVVEVGFRRLRIPEPACLLGPNVRNARPGSLRRGRAARAPRN